MSLASIVVFRGMTGEALSQWSVAARSMSRATAQRSSPKAIRQTRFIRSLAVTGMSALVPSTEMARP